MHVDLMRDSVKLFPQLPQREGITSLRVWHCKYKSLMELASFINLEELVIASFPDGTLEALAALRSLKYLSIIHLPHVTDLSPLSKLSQLETLSLATLPSWDASSKCSVVQSLAPIGEMESLKHLELFGVRPEDMS